MSEEYDRNPFLGKGIITFSYGPHRKHNSFRHQGGENRLLICSHDMMLAIQAILEQRDGPGILNEIKYLRKKISVGQIKIAITREKEEEKYLLIRENAHMGLHGDTNPTNLFMIEYGVMFVQVPIHTFLTALIEYLRKSSGIIVLFLRNSQLGFEKEVDGIMKIFEPDKAP